MGPIRAARKCVYPVGHPSLMADRHVLVPCPHPPDRALKAAGSECSRRRQPPRYSRRITATTRPRIEASSPGIGS